MTNNSRRPITLVTVCKVPEVGRITSVYSSRIDPRGDPNDRDNYRRVRTTVESVGEHAP